MESFVTRKLLKVSRLFYKFPIMISKPSNLNKEDWANVTFNLKNKM